MYHNVGRDMGQGRVLGAQEVDPFQTVPRILTVGPTGRKVTDIESLISYVGIQDVQIDITRGKIVRRIGVSFCAQSKQLIITCQLRHSNTRIVYAMNLGSDGSKAK